MEHTKLPWKIHKKAKWVIAKDIDGMDASIGETYGDTDMIAEKNSEFIVKACNSYYELLEACKAAYWALNTYDPSIAENYAQKARPKLLKAIKKAKGE